MASERILVVDDEPGVRAALSGILADDGFQVSCAESGEAAVETIGGATFDAVLLDIWLPGMDGLETLSRLREVAPDTEVVMISGHGTIETAVRATKLGAFDFVENPLSLERTLLVLRNALERRGELATLRACGFRGGRLAALVVAENAVLLVAGIGIGAAAGIVAVLPHLAGGNAPVPWSGLAVTLGAVLLVGLLASIGAVIAAVRAPLIPILKAE